MFKIKIHRKNIRIIFALIFSFFKSLFFRESKIPYASSIKKATSGRTIKKLISFFEKGNATSQMNKKKNINCSRDAKIINLAIFVIFLLTYFGKRIIAIIEAIVEMLPKIVKTVVPFVKISSVFGGSCEISLSKF